MRYGVLLLSALVVACGKDAAGPLPDEPGDPSAVAGTWTYFEHISNATLQLSCDDQGTLAITQNAHDLSGSVDQTGFCSAPGGGADNSGTGSFTGNVGAATVRLDVSGCAYHGALFNTPRDSANGTVSCRINAGAPIGTVNLTGTWLAVKGTELAPPTVSGGVIIAPGDTLAVTGETVRISIAASDDRRLGWVGYRVGAPANVRDSVPVTAAAYVDTIDLVVPAAWAGASTVTVFAYDAFNRYSETAAGHFTALDAVRRSFQTVSLGARAVDMAYDPVRNVIYFAEPESARVAILALSSFALGTPIPLPMTPSGANAMGLDIVPGGDTVLAGLPGTQRIAVLDRLASTVDTLHITGPDFLDYLRVTSSRKALIAGSGSGGGYTFFGIWERDLATGTDTRRTDIGISGNINPTGAPLVRSPDQSRLLLTDIGTSCGYVYDASAGSFSACSHFGFSANARGTGSTTGGKWLVGNKLVDSTLTLLATVPGIGPDDNVAIATDGATAYRPTLYGYDKLALPSGAVLERVRITVSVGRITALPGGTRLFLWTGAMETARATVVTLP